MVRRLALLFACISVAAAITLATPELSAQDAVAGTHAFMKVCR